MPESAVSDLQDRLQDAAGEIQTSLFGAFEATTWPAREAFPLNEGGSRVETIVGEDLAISVDFLAVTGYSSLEHLVRTFGVADWRAGQHVRIVLGNEPLASSAFRARRHQPLPEAMREYWLQQGISILLCGPVLRLIDHIREGRVRFRALDGLHAKVYVGDHHAALGSSNFSRSGLREQREANVRFAREGAEAGRYNDARRIAENFWRSARPVDDQIVALLERLLQAVTWQEALARAVSELLEGDWIKHYPRLFRTAGERPLWPSQVQAVAQALWVLDTRGSVLIADPTGSGKTRLGVTLLWALINRLWATGRSHRARCVVVCPPQVQTNWDEEAGETGAMTVQTISQGVLSHGRSIHHERAVKRVRDASVLFVDEAHNYLNAQSGRSRQVLVSAADHTALLTATPINRGAQDLLRLVELLGLDNLSDGEYRTFRTLRAKRGGLAVGDEHLLRDFVERFTVRRTKAELNRLVDADPDAYHNRLGDRCRYPEHRSYTYPTGETPQDVALAEEVDSLTQRLRGLLYLRQVQVPDDSAVPPEAAVKGRLAAAAALARYNVRAALRSSPAALLEHVHGTAYAIEHYGLEPFKAATGNVVGTLASIRFDAQRGWRPETNVSDALPDWLTDSALLAEAAEEETRLYEEIARLATRMSDARQRARIALLTRLQREHGLLLAYDRSLITLEHLRTMAQREGASFKPIVVTGTQNVAKRKIKHLFALGSDAHGVVALCSDAMSEGVNLQQASAVVFLDAPSVIRLAEQRVGRVDRMDSPHAAIEVYWPNDSPAFALRSSRRFVERYMTVERILGSNMPLPEELLEAGFLEREETIEAEELIAAYEQRQQEAARDWDGLHDAFQPVRELVTGAEALVPEAAYKGMRGAEATVMSKVSLVRAARPWGFFAIRGSEKRAPRWILLEEGKTPAADLAQVCSALRERLRGAEQLSWSDAAATQVSALLLQLRTAERQDLPNRRRHALSVMARVLKAYEQEGGAPERQRVVGALQRALAEPAPHEPGVDLYELAQAWLDVVRPVFLRVQARRKKHPLRLKSKALYDELTGQPLPTEVLAEVEARVEVLDPLERRVAACIVGVPAHAEQL